MATTVSILPSEISSLAPMPVSVVQLAGMAMDEKASIADMARIIQYDEALTSNLLRMANSVLGGSRMPVMTVKDAVVRLGTSHVLKYAVGQQIAGPMSRACPGYQLGEHDLWRHSVAAALAAEHLNRFLYKPVPGLAFTAALLHDVGKLVLSRHIDPETLGEIRKAIAMYQVTFVEAEHKVLGTDHAEVGGAVGRHWKFPKQLVDTIELHHCPDRNPDALLDVVYLADAVAKVATAEAEGENNLSIESLQVPKRLGVTLPVLESMCVKVRNDLKEEEKRLGIPGSAA